MEKFNHIAYMFNERTKGKKYENYVVNAIYTKINNPELIPVTQQCVRNDMASLLSISKNKKRAVSEFNRF